jgi:hypothetical protein
LLWQAGVLAIATLCLAAPEADPAYALYAPWAYPYAYRPYYASGYAGPLPGHSYQAVTRLHKREAEADPQILLNAAPAFPFAAAPALPLAAAPAFSFAAAPAVFNAPLVKSVVETPATVAHAIHASPLLSYAPVAPVAAVHTGPLVLPTAGVPVALGPHDCVTEGGCALKAALATGLPASTVGATTVYGRKRREAEAEATADAEAAADAEADPYLLYGNYYGHPYAAYPYYNYAPYAAYAPYYAGYAPYYAAALTAPVAAPLAAPLPVAAPVAAVHTVAAPAVVETVSKPVSTPLFEFSVTIFIYRHRRRQKRYFSCKLFCLGDIHSSGGPPHCAHHRHPDRAPPGREVKNQR